MCWHVATGLRPLEPSQHVLALWSWRANEAFAGDLGLWFQGCEIEVWDSSLNGLLRLETVTWSIQRRETNRAVRRKSINRERWSQFNSYNPQHEYQQNVDYDDATWSSWFVDPLGFEETPLLQLAEIWQHSAHEVMFILPGNSFIAKSPEVIPAIQIKRA